MEHSSTFCATLQFSVGYLLSKKRIIEPKVDPNFGIVYQAFTLGLSLKHSSNLVTKIPL